MVFLCNNQFLVLNYCVIKFTATISLFPPPLKIFFHISYNFLKIFFSKSTTLFKSYELPPTNTTHHTTSLSLRINSNCVFEEEIQK
jgi:hypothetical protein